MGFEDRFSNRFRIDLPSPLPLTSLKRKQSFSDKFWKKTLRSSFKLPRYGTLRARSKQRITLPDPMDLLKPPEPSEDDRNPINLNEDVKGCLPMTSTFSVISLNGTSSGIPRSQDMTTFHQKLQSKMSWRNSNLDIPNGHTNFYGFNDSNLARTDYSCRVIQKPSHSSSCTDLNTIYRNPSKNHLKRSSLVISPTEKPKIKPPIAEKPKLNKLPQTPPRFTTPPQRYSPETDMNNNIKAKIPAKTEPKAFPYIPMKHSPPPPPVRNHSTLSHKYHSELDLTGIGKSRSVLGGSVMDLNKMVSPKGYGTLSRRILPQCGHGINIDEISKVKLRPIRALESA